MQKFKIEIKPSWNSNIHFIKSDLNLKFRQGTIIGDIGRIRVRNLFVIAPGNNQKIKEMDLPMKREHIGLMESWNEH
jgi:hypothetical protein